VERTDANNSLVGQKSRSAAMLEMPTHHVATLATVVLCLCVGESSVDFSSR